VLTTPPIFFHRAASEIFRGGKSIFFRVIFALALGAVNAHLFVILLQGRQILTSLGEFALLHTFANVPVHESPLGVHQVKLVVQPGPRLGDGRGVAQHADGTLNFGEIATGNNRGWLIIDANLEASWAPVDELDGPLGLDGGDRGVDVFGDDVATEEEATRHVFTMTRIAFHHLIGGLEAGVGNLCHGELLVVSLLRRDDGRVSRKREVDTRVRDQVSLELGQVHIQGPVKSQGSSDGRDDLTDETIQVGVSGPLDVEISPADVIDGFVVDHEGAVRVLQGGVSGENGIVWFNHRRGNLRSRVDGELKLGLLAIIHREPLHEKGGKSRSGATTERVEDEEALKTSALIGGFADAIEDDVDELFADGVVTTGVVVSSVLFASYQLLRVEELTVGSGPDFVDDGGLQIDEDGARDVFAGSGLAEKRVERVVASADGLIGGHLSIGLNSVLQAVQFPAGIAHLDTGLADMNGNDLSHCEW